MNSQDYISQAREQLAGKLDKFSPYYEPKRKHRKQPERDLVNSIIQLLNYKGHFVWKTVNRGFRLEATGAWIPPSNRGVPDILGVYGGKDSAKRGTMIAIEAKTAGNRPTMAQEAFLEEVKRRGGIARTVYQLEDIKDL